MDRFDKQTYEIIKRLQNARLSLLGKQPFYALLLLHMKFALDLTCETAYTDGTRIAFNPDFITSLSDRELEFVLMHEVLHAALGHPFRKQSDYDLECYDKACDIVVNSNILYSFDMDLKVITLKKYGVAMHKTPSGKQGYECTVEEVYAELLKASGKQQKNKKNTGAGGGNGQNGIDGDSTDGNVTGGEVTEGEATDGDGAVVKGVAGSSKKKSHAECADGEGSEGNSKKKSASKNSRGESEASESEAEDSPLEDMQEDMQGEDSNTDSSNGDGSSGKGASGKGAKDKAGEGGFGEGASGKYGSNNLQKGGKSSASAGKSGGKTSMSGGCGAGGEITEDDIQGLVADLLKSRAVHGKIDPNKRLETDDLKDDEKEGTVDDHSFWNGDEEDNIGRDTWLHRLIETTDIIASSEGGKGRGTVPLAAERIVEELKNPILDWKTILNDFVQEEICDYSFSPPDKRMEDSPFFLPDFNEKDESVKNILFMIDTSGSMSNSQITECYSEIYGAIQQFGGKLEGKLGFFDAVVVEPTEFTSEEEFKIIRPKGGGGTSFDIIFDYVHNEMEEEPPVSIVILTDGFAPFPEESKANGIPVLWIINNKEAEPPWGKIARIIEDAPKSVHSSC